MVQRRHAACQRGERCLYFPMEESQAQILRNMQSIGLDLRRWISCGLLRFRPARPHQYGLEAHLGVIHREIAAFEPQVVAIDPNSQEGQAARKGLEGLRNAHPPGTTGAQ